MPGRIALRTAAVPGLRISQDYARSLARVRGQDAQDFDTVGLAAPRPEIDRVRQLVVAARRAAREIEERGARNDHVRLDAARLGFLLAPRAQAVVALLHLVRLALVGGRRGRRGGQ